ncbi:MAG: tetratricopeptide repeat protein, partial [Candidatus Binataceae bacterium]
LGNLYFGQSSFGAAEEQYRAAVAIAPERAEYHARLAQALTKENKTAEAEGELRTAIGLQPKNAAAHLALAALLYTEPNHQAEAKAEYAQAVALNPGLATPAPAATSTPATVASVSAVAPPSTFRVRRLNKRFLLTHDSPVYDKPDAASPVLARVHQRKFVHVTGITGDWFEIKMRNGTVGFIPTSAAM